MELVFTKDKTTKGAVRYGETPNDADSHPISIYLSKERVKELGNPEQIRVTIEAT